MSLALRYADRSSGSLGLAIFMTLVGVVGVVGLVPKLTQMVRISWEETTLLSILWLKALAILVIGTWGGLTEVREIRSKVDLIESGIPVLGAIEEARFDPDSRCVNYTYLVAAIGGQQPCAVKGSGSFYKPPQRIKVGAVVLVVYDLADANRHALDLFDARREDRLRLLTDEKQMVLMNALARRSILQQIRGGT